MGKYIITIDTGTTNTRAILWDAKRRMVHTEKATVGVRNTAIDGNNSRLKEAVKNCLDALVLKEGISYDEVQCVIASGMITSNVGLVEIPHIVVPAGIDDLARAITKVSLPDVCPVPIHFIPGIKNSGGNIDWGNFECMDIMRGEEVESCAIIEHLPKGTSALLILPGSHTKFISVDEGGRMTGCLTSITGELLSSITNDTIIADAVGHQFVEQDTYDKEMVLLGYDTAKKTGLGRTCFSGRILSQFVTKDHTKVANFIFGAALQNDVTAIKNSSALHISSDTHVAVAGKNPFRQAILDILRHEGSFAAVSEYISDGDLPLSALGAYLIAERRNIL